MSRQIIVALFLSLFALGFPPRVACESAVLFSKPNTTYTIKSVLDLEGGTITIPKGCTIIICRNGFIKNGRLVGNETKLKIRGRKNHFQAICIEGIWHISKIYSEWFDLRSQEDNTQSIRSIFSLCDSMINNDVYFQAGDFYLVSYDEEDKSPSIIRIPSKTRVHNEATFHARPGSHEQSFLFYFSNVSDCLWDGGTIIGDLETHVGEKGEQGFGIALRGANNITIRNVSCRDCWGDGINLQYAGAGRHNENITIDSVICDGNRRQGISIEDGVNVVVTNSTFRNTGLFRGTNPKYGIDIEPCYEGAAIRHITIADCTFENNDGGGLNCSFIKPTDCDICISNCLDDRGGLRINGCAIDNLEPGIAIRNYQCEAGKLRFKRDVQNVQISNCSFMSVLNETGNIDRLSNLLFENLHLKTSEQRTWNYYCLSLVCESIEDVTFNNCSFEVLVGSTLSAVLPSGGDWSGVRMYGCSIIEHRDNTIYVPCDIYRSRIESSKPIAFTNHKKQGTLRFYDNSVVVRSPIEDSPFRFQSTSNQEYDISNNDIHYFGVIDEGHLVKNTKSNSRIPQVRFSQNNFHKLH